MSKRSPVHAEVIAREDETPERLIKRFLRKVKKDNLMELFMNKYWGASHFEKPSVRTRSKMIRSRFRTKQEQLRNNVEE